MIRRRVVAAALLATSAAPVLAGPVNAYASNRVFAFADALTQFIGGSTVLTDEPPAFNGVFDSPDVPHPFGARAAVAPMPEPSTWVLVGTGLAGAGFAARRRMGRDNRKMADSSRFRR